MNHWEVLHRFMENLRRTWVVNLMDDDIELESSSQCVHFKLITPNSIFLHSIAILVNGLVIFDESYVIIRIGSDIINSFLPVVPIILSVPIKVVSYSPEQAIAIRFHLIHFQSLRLQLDFEIQQVVLEPKSIDMFFDFFDSVFRFLVLPCLFQVFDEITNCFHRLSSLFDFVFVLQQFHILSFQF